MTDEMMALYEQALEKIRACLVADASQSGDVVSFDPSGPTIGGRLDANSWYPCHVPEDLIRIKGAEWVAEQFVQLYGDAKRRYSEAARRTADDEQRAR